MGRDVKILQRGVNVQANDLATPPGTLIDGDNLDFDRDGVAQRRPGFGNNFLGLPWFAVDCGLSSAFGSGNSTLGATRGFYDLFSGSNVFHLNNGMLFSGEYTTGSVTMQWYSVPVNASHRISDLGTIAMFSGIAMVRRIGRMLAFCAAPGNGLGGSGYFNWQSQQTYTTFCGAPCNDASQATDASGTINQKFFDPNGVAVANGTIAVSDNTNIRSSGVLASNKFTFSVLAGSITVAGYTDATGTSARFSGASFICGDVARACWYVADNTNAIRKITSGGVVTTVAGSITAGDSDGAGVGTRFRTISGMAYDNSQFLYVTESSGHRVRRVDVVTGSVTIFAGLLTPPTAGSTNGVGTAARFNTPNGIAMIGDSLFVGDTGNGFVRRIVIASASVTNYAGHGNGSLATGMVGGSSLGVNPAYIPSVTVRSSMLSIGPQNNKLTSNSYLCVECPAPNSSTDLGLVLVPTVNGAPTAAVVAADSTRDMVYHYARCPNAYPSNTTGPTKVDFWGFNSYRDQDVRGIDVQGGVVFNTMERPRIIDVYSRINVTDSMPRLRPVGIDWPEAPSCTTTAGTTFANNTTWAYRTVCGMTLPNGRVILGPPSERIIVSNTSGTTTAGSVTAFASPGLPYDGMPFVQVYRTQTFSSSVDPGDQMFLCYEAPLTYGQGVSFTDSAPDGLLGAELYTNNTQLQAQAASLPPPSYVNEVSGFDGRLVCANYADQAYCRIKVLGTSPLAAGTSTITLTCIGPGSADVSQTLTLTAAASNNITSKQFGIGSGGSAAQNAVQTARNVAYLVNRTPDAFMFRAYYDESDPGAVVIYSTYPGRSNAIAAVDQTLANTLTQSAVTFSTNAPTAFFTVSQSTALRKQANIRWSDQNNPDSFPVVNQKTVGASTESILRVLPISETLLVVKDHTIHRSDNTFNFQFYNQALSCLLPNSFARLNNQWFGLFTRGFMALSSAQANPAGRPIDRAAQLRYGTGSVIFGTNGTDFASAASVEKRGLYVCRFNDKIFTYNDYAKTWGTMSWDLDQQPTWLGSHGDALLASVADYPRAAMWQLNTPGRWTKITDQYEDFTFLITYSTGSITITPGSGPLSDAPSASLLTNAVFYQGGGAGSLTTILSASTSGNGDYAVTTDIPIGSPGGYLLYFPIKVSALYAPTVSPGTNQRFGDALAILECARAGTVTATFYSRKDTGLVNTQVPPVGVFKAGSGVDVPGTIVLPTGAVEFTDYVYYLPMRFPAPAARASGSEVSVRLVEDTTFQPLAIKLLTVETISTDNAKVLR